MNVDSGIIVPLLWVALAKVKAASPTGVTKPGRRELPVNAGEALVSEGTVNVKLSTIVIK